jgi:AAA domain, putative AbiEii toxin, Type IV TA system
MPRLRLRSLKVHAFRDVRPGTELRFGHGFHLILGKNASGKSTLLELLAAVSTLNFRGPFFAETPFHLEASLEVGRFFLLFEVRRTFEAQRLKYADLPTTEKADAFMAFEISDSPFSGWAHTQTGKGMSFHTTDPRRGDGRSAPTDVVDVSDPLLLSIGVAAIFDWLRAKAGEEVGTPYSSLTAAFGSTSRHLDPVPPFDETLGTLHTMVGTGLIVEHGREPHTSSPWLPPALDFDAQGSSVTLDLLKDPLLGATVKLLGYDGAQAYLGPGAPSANSEAWTYPAPSFQFFRRGRAVRRHDQLSFGQKRLFSFAWYLACNPYVAIADELVNGLNLEWIDWCVEAIGDRQCFLTCQNPLLMDAVPFASEEDLRLGIILCEATRDPALDMAELSWRQLDDRQADIVTRALRQSRLDLLSDLLHALDLW